ncbi:MAG TPA: AAA family ATPase [Stellaceae bacterium]|nr:AAA family ATPase [Stellaceae bacterium]
MDIAAWLQDLGLERYAPAFRDNEINERVLPSLTAEDLKDLGVTLVGHRRLLLDAIAALGSAGTAAAASATAVTAAPADVRASADAERRQLTGMFCDLVGSTALSTRHDPEDLRELVGDYHRAVAETVGRFDGFVAKYMGDGVLIYFGYPQAHEDDAERAVRAGLAVIEAVGQLPAREDLSVRLGIATGLAVVGDLIGEGAAQERGVVGETPNLAARLQGLAAPNTLIIAEATRRQIGGLFDLEDLGPQQLAGFAELQRAWRVLGESGAVSRFEALRSGETPLVGREEEVELLVRRWEQAKSGEGRVVLISGEPGIGKSRLTVVLSEHIGGEPHTRLRYFCSPHHQDSALHPFIEQLERAAGFARDDTADTKLAKLQALLASGTADYDDITLLSELLSLPSSATELNLSPQRERENLFEAMLGQLEAEARQRPVLMVFEDAHWIDPTSRELLDLAVDRVRRLPVLLAITFRPEFQPPWGGRSHVTSLALNRLGERAGEALVQNLAGNAALTAEMVAEIVERTDGVPLFVEELTKAVRESAEQGDRVAAVLGTASQTALSVPATLHASLMARLDRLGPAAKEIAQIGAVLGREFAYELIEPVAQHPERELQAALDQLDEAGLLFCRGTPPQATYLFKHALVQDAAYSTLLRGRRQELHGRVAAALEAHFADLVERQPELLAHHLTAAGATERAVDQWLKAGRHAAARLAYVEAIAHLNRGLGLLHSIPESPVRSGREIELQLALGFCLFTAKGAIAAKPAYTRALELAESSGEPQQRFEALYGAWQSTRDSVSGGIAAARSLSERLLRMAEPEGDDGLRLQAHHSGWTTRLHAGDPAKTREHADAGRLLYDPEKHASHRLVYGGHDPGVCAQLSGALAEWLLGYPDKALASIAEGLALAERIAHPFTLGLALLQSSEVYLNLREPERALRQLDAAEAVAAEQRLSLMSEPGMLRGAALLEQNAVDEAIARIREGVAKWTGLGRTKDLPYGLAFLAEGLARHGDRAAALAALREGLEIADATGEHKWDAELHRVTGTVLLAENKLDEGQAALQEAIRIAQAQHAKSLELRAVRDLTRLWGEQGRRAEARDLLAPVYGWFTEGFDTADLKEAKALLDELM